MVHARMDTGGENSGKLVAKVKNEARRIAEALQIEVVLVDGSPGIGCPVVSSLAGAHLVVLVAEPTLSGLHDLKRIYQLIERFGIRTACMINKADLNLQIKAEIEAYLKEKGIFHISSLPYDEAFIRAIVSGQTVIEYGNSRLIPILNDSWSRILKMIKEN